MKFLIYSSDGSADKDKLELVQNLLLSLYKDSDVELRTNKVPTSTVKKYVDSGDKVFDVSHKKNYQKGVFTFDLKKGDSTGAFIYDVINYVNVGISEKSVQNAIKVANRVK